jgi:glycosyltransferase involved in cell wall biosynthesis
LTTVFISIPWFHPAFRAGGPVQSIANLVNEFREDITYKIFCGNTDLNNTSLENIETGKWVFYNECTEVWYASPHDRSSVLLKQLEKTKPDILFIIGIFSWHFNLVPLLFYKAQKKIISVRGMLHPGALSQKPAKKKGYIFLFKLLQLTKKTFLHATDEAEKAIITEVLGNEAKIFVAGNFPHKIVSGSASKKNKGRLKLITVALVSPMKNHLMILEALMNCTSGIEFHICGPVKDMEYWQLCLKQQKKLPGNISVHYHGDVQPGQVADHLDKADVFILPSKSENFGHALYEALSAGKPVITSRFTPWEGLDKAQAGMNVETEVMPISNAIERFAEMNNEEFTEWRNGAIQYSEKAIDLKKIKEQYRRMFSINEPVNKFIIQ